MAFADPQTVTINSIAIPLPRVSSGNGSGAFQSADGDTLVDIRNSYGKRIRRTARITTKKISADPLTPSNNVPVTASFYVVADVPVQGYTAAEMKDIATGFMTWLTASSGANLTKLFGGEA